MYCLVEAMSVAAAAALLAPSGRFDRIVEEFKAKRHLNFFEMVRLTARVEDLAPEQQAFFRHVEAHHTGVCSRCRWRTGCLRCDKSKAWKECIKCELRNRGYDVLEKPEAGVELEDLSQFTKRCTSLTQDFLEYRVFRTKRDIQLVTIHIMEYVVYEPYMYT